MADFKQISSIFIAASLLLASPLLAGELKGPAVAQAINGKRFSCKAGSLKFTMKFAKVAPKGSEFPFRFESSVHAEDNAFLIKKNGKVISKTGRSSRRIYPMDGGGISIKASGRPTAKCTRM